MTWYVKRTPYVVLILMYSRSSGFFPFFFPSRPASSAQSAYLLSPSHPLILSPFSPSHHLPFSPSSPLTFSTIIYHYYIYFFLKIK